jgi:serine O-acetyltransferase
MKIRRALDIETDVAIHSVGSATGVKQLKKPPPFWQTVRADIGRFREEDDCIRVLVRGLLSQGFQALFVYRIFRWFYERRVPTQPVRFFIERFIEIMTGISIPAQAAIGKGLRIHHFGGVIVHSAAVVGEYCTLYHGVTLGDRGGWGGAPRVGDRVLIGAGAKLIGEIIIGDDCVIGANAVVNISVPAGHVAVGVPAVIKETVAPDKRGRSAREREPGGC